MIGGYIIQHFEKPPKIPLIVKCIFWILTSTTWFILIFGTWNKEFTILETSLYVSFGHTGVYLSYIKIIGLFIIIFVIAWGIMLLWLTISCCWYPGILKNFLSYKIFLPLGRITYCTYLVSPLVMLVIVLQFEASINFQTGMIVRSLTY